eukprot:TRINITY_DN11790_c0_g1_i2.p2 TRINITY_DN11790_c0_g1~~TRINITY_DN11790_c0_g1_i2.p2  ORF type:complete len:231 (+),score=-16.06 TRINITY_DN11790_c0_g1_i2:342-1034(+)
MFCELHHGNYGGFRLLKGQKNDFFYIPVIMSWLTEKLFEYKCSDLLDARSFTSLSCSRSLRPSQELSQFKEIILNQSPLQLFLAIGRFQHAICLYNYSQNYSFRVFDNSSYRFLFQPLTRAYLSLKLTTKIIKSCLIVQGQTSQDKSLSIFCAASYDVVSPLKRYGSVQKAVEAECCSRVSEGGVQRQKHSFLCAMRCFSSQSLPTATRSSLLRPQTLFICYIMSSKLKS